MRLDSLFLMGALTTMVLTQSTIPNVIITKSTTSMYQLIKDLKFAFVLEAFLSLASGGGAASGEPLPPRVKPSDCESWYNEFN
ncbi:hypothetical protein PISL3812_06035 [Talaromyces islandicus]|uniref:Uncharacterized protein n=1 Tax=Talaromyces islandicus TaxID=28573 RepID=A0A0U1M1W3_TALIS|nr:hypothetical protein PISL3812_06035 [Talaromyces islandicus]